MADNITTDNIINLDSPEFSTPREFPSDNSKFLARTNGTDEVVFYSGIYEKTKDILQGDEELTWIADRITGSTGSKPVPITSEGVRVSDGSIMGEGDGKVLIYRDQEGSFHPEYLHPNDIDWSSFDENDFVKINSNGELVPSTISVTDITPTSTNNADKFLQVSSDGTQIIESDFDFDSLLHYPDVSENNANTINSGLFVAGYSTVNRPSTGEQGYILSSRLRTDPSQQNPRVSQVFISTDSDDVKVRRNKGDLGINDFNPWYTLYHNSNHPISSSNTSTSTTELANSLAVKKVNDRIDVLNAEYNANTILSKLLTVDGSGSSLDADKLDGYHFSDLESRFVNVTGDSMSGDLVINNAKTRYTRGSSYIEVYSENSRAVLSANNTIALLNGSNAQRMNTGGLLVSNSYSQETLVPSNGIYSRGLVKSGTGYSVNNTEVIDNSGNMSWDRLKNVPSEVDNLGSASQRDVGTAPNQVPLNSTLASLLLPVGAVLPFAGDTAPDGWLVCDGSAISRSGYSMLYAYIGTKYGTGNGSTTFNLPDMRDEFIRGASATRPVGNQESDMFKSHTHGGSTNTTGNHTHSGSTTSAGSHTHTYSKPDYITVSKSDKHRDHRQVVSNRSLSNNTSSAGAHTHDMSLDDAGNHSHTVSISGTGGSETRPRNIAMLYCIKY